MEVKGKRFGVAVLLLLLAGCGSATQAGDPILNLAIGLGAAAHRRSQGECWTTCIHGTRCNPETGVCERLPCGKECDPGLVCDVTSTPPTCLPAALLNVQTVK